ncbi:uncharacterized protein RCC_08632 [Ramularia collo-cygni]|uniref:N-acetyltransferase domain-containing protein n=1 Tax=Ramularia collo-cygni TaxID=112498 RepID=A0A2D3VKK9_9PEZI|nr:uncharacterized protein RCC_08632 [Ramularia collo-cygni]CZT22924.1 uncharacterized protein RCC_08632 [Ramularia collo-cygni]
MSTSQLTIRPAALKSSDHELLIDFKDSQLEWLSEVGSTEQWGTQPAREGNPSVLEKCRQWVEKSESHVPWGAEWCRAFVAETSTGTPVAGLVLDSKAPAYVRAILPGQDEQDPFVYLAYLISNRNAGGEKKGAGAALINVAKEQTRKAGLNRICLDCFRGNGRKLVKYYESQGFVSIGDFSASVPDKDDWLGCVMEMRV